MTSTRTPLRVLNLESATFECTYGRGCAGICCRNGRPPVSAEETARIDANLHKILPLLRPKQRQAVEQEGYVSRRRKAGNPMLRVLDGWCIFFNGGCALHKLGAEEGDAFAYKPAPCSLFPLEHDGRGRWYVRQHGYKGEQWDLFCLAPTNTTVRATDSLTEELRLARQRMEVTRHAGDD